jgi:hypothetical protein
MATCARDIPGSINILIPRRKKKYRVQEGCMDLGCFTAAYPNILVFSVRSTTPLHS